MSAIPTPKPRALSHDKRPIPLPRSSVQKQDVAPELPPTPPKVIDVPHTTLTRRISNTSKQIVEEISSVLDQTRQSLKKKHRKSVEEQHDIVEKEIAQSPEFFNTIRFESPLTVVQSTSEPSSYIEENEFYRRLNSVNETVSDDECDSHPPPVHPPPPLPDMSMYDTPHKNESASINSPPILNSRPGGKRLGPPPALPYVPPPSEDEIPVAVSKPFPISPKIPIPTRTPPITPRLAPPHSDKPPPTPTRPAPVVSQSNVGVPIEERTTYEAVFPVYPVFSQATDSESSGESRSGTMDRTTSIRPESWNFYDPVTLNDSTYMNVASYRKNRFVILLN